MPSSRGKFPPAPPLESEKVDLKLFIKDVDDPHSKKRPLTVKSWSTIKDIKDHIQKELHVPPHSQRLYFGNLLKIRSHLPNRWTLQDAGIYKNGETIYLKIEGSHCDVGLNLNQSSNSLESISVSISGQSVQSTGSHAMSTLKPNNNDICISKHLLPHTSKALQRLVEQARRGMSLGLKPNLVLDGSGGTYFLHDARKVRVGVFKPADEEPYAENNPRGHVRIEDTSSSSGAQAPMSMREGIQPGEACWREVAAYLLDHDCFADVPLTTLAEARHPAFHQNGSMLSLNQGGAAVGSHSLGSGKHSQEHLVKVGSFQEYINGECCMDDLSPTKITSIDEVHKIAVLDIRIMNADRNTANLICRRDPENPDYFELIPIDHGYCLRTVADVCWFDWCWLDWPQLKEPVSQKTKNYIMNLNIEEDVKMLREKLNIPERALDYFRASNRLLQEGIRNGMTLYDIAILCCRNDDCGELPSRLETLISMADEISKSAVDNGRWHHAAASKALESQLSPHVGINHRKTLSMATGVCSNMFKSQSSMNLSSFLSESSNNSPPTPMAQSSASDSCSSSTVTTDQEEQCKEWAASMITNALDNPSPKRGATRRQRSISFARSHDESDHHLSCSDHSVSSYCDSETSPAGFWHVPPSASKDDLDESSWSPFASPALRSASPDNVSQVDIDNDSLELGKGAPQRLVKFDLGNLIPPMSMRQSTVNLQAEDQPIEHGLPLIPNSPKSMRRSVSYSAFSFKRLSDDDLQPRNFSAVDHQKQLKHYFHKFIDLLIDREITPKVRSRQISIEGYSDAKKTDMEMVRRELEKASVAN